ncbi:GAF domain-containing protein [Haladaptatus sp. DFWS20]|uniref:GAF domain-containing protein n=1 Tax=Haladaptatus sp. DFWS20 TaxID=3403467 RepID=UPI003EB83A0E
MSSSTPSPATVLEVFDTLDPPGTPLTTPEVAAEFDCTDRTIYNKLDSLAEEGNLETKKVGARGRVWWRPLQRIQVGDRIAEPEPRNTIVEASVDNVYERDLAVVTFDADLRFSYLNSQAETWLNTTEEDVRGRFVWDVFERDERADEALSKALESQEPTRYQAYYEPGDRWFNNYVYPSDSGISIYFSDITKRKKAESERNAVEEQLMTELEAMNRLYELHSQLVETMVLSDMLEEVLEATIELQNADFGNIQLYNPNTQSLSITVEQGLSQEFVEHFATVDAGDDSACGRALREQRRIIIEDIETDSGFEPHRSIAADVGYRAVQATPIYDSSGEPLGMISTQFQEPHRPSERKLRLTDIYMRVAAELIERERTEETLRESGRRYRTLFESINEGFCIIEVVFDENGEQVDYRFLETNPSFEEITGLTDVDGTLWSDLESEYDLHWLDIHDEVIQLGESERFEASGQPLTDGWYDVSAFPFGGSDSGTVALLINDITARKRLERELRTEKEQLDVAVGNSPITLFRLDTDLRYTWVKNAHEDFDVEAVLGKRDDELLPPPAAETIMAPKRTTLETGEGVREELAYELPSGKVNYDLTVEPVRDESGEITGLTCASLNITERKKAEEELQKRADLDAFRVALADELRPITDPTEIQNVAAHVIGEQLDVERAYYGEVLADGNTNLIHADYCREDVPSVVGEHHFDDFGEYIADGFKNGDTLVIDDFSIIPKLSEDERIAHEKMDIGAYISVPLIKDGQLTAYFGITQSTPREWTDAEIAMLEETAERTWMAVERARAEQALRESEEQLRRTNESLERLSIASRELIDADTETISDRVAELTWHVTNVEYVALWRYDGTVGELREDTSHTTPEKELDAVQLPERLSEQVWQTFISDDTDVDNDLDVSENRPGESPLRSRILVPLGRHGVICAGSTRTGTFDEQTVDLVETVAATVKSSWDRAEGEQVLAQQNEELEHFERLYTLMWKLNQALVQADTVEAIDQATCERLADSDLYDFVWIGDYDADSKTVEPRAWAGVDSNYLDDLKNVADESGSNRSPFMSAARTGKLQVVADVATDARATPWREATLDRGVRSCLSIPLVYDEFVYGVLTVYDGSPQHDESDTGVLAELGQTIGHAIHAVETRETFETDNVVELTLQSTAAEMPLCRLTRETGCTIEFEGSVSLLNGDIISFLTATGISPDEFVAAGEQSIAIEELNWLADRKDRALYQVRLATPTLASRLLELDATVQSLTIDAGTVTTVIYLPETGDVRKFINRIQLEIPDIELLARRTRTRPFETGLTLMTTFEARLTTRQQEVLQLAYRSGFFESPRVRTGKELSDALDISQSTFNYHLRGAERKLCEMVLEHS